MSENYRGEDLWIYLCKRAKGKCEYCGRNLFESFEEYLLAQQDHIIPWRSGGENTFENSALSCYICNVMLKGGWDPTLENSSELISPRDLIGKIKEYVDDRNRSNWRRDLYERIKGEIEEEGSSL